MINDAIIKFYKESFSSQSLEAKINNFSNTQSIMREVDIARNRLGQATCHLLAVAVPERCRHQRLFRSKYTSEVSINILEESLISAANKIIDDSIEDGPLISARPHAWKFLSLLARVQTAVSILVNEALDEYLVLRRSPLKSPFASRYLLSPPELSFFEPVLDSTEALTSDDLGCPYWTGEENTEGGRNLQVLRDPSSVEEVPPVPALHDQWDDQNVSAFHSRLPGLPQPNSHYLRQWSRADELVDCLGGFFNPSVASPQRRLQAITPPDTLIDLLTKLDRSMASFEFELVKVISHGIRTEAEASVVHEVTVLFSETIQWALAVGLISQSHLADRDPLLILSLPRLAVLVGCRMLVDCPIGPRRLASGCRLPFMFADSGRELSYLARQTAALRGYQLWRLACWLSPFGVSEIDAKSISASTVPPKRSAHQPPYRHFAMNTFGLHTIYKCITAVADSMSFHHPVEFRDILQISIQLNDVEAAGTAGNYSHEDTVQLSVEPTSLLQSVTPVQTFKRMALSIVFDWIKAVSIPKAILPEQLFPPLVCDSVRHKKSEESLEIGIDVAAYIVDSAIDLTTNNFMATCSSVKDPTVALKIAGHPLFSCWLTRNASVEGYFDCCFGDSSGLPPWQPDCPAGRQGTTSSEESEASDSEGEESSTAGQRWSRIARIGRECAGCRAKFNFFRRRHHCRRCGHIFCASCCSTWTSIEAVSPSLRVRVCSECADFVGSARLSPGEAHSHLE